ncbi:AimR family lysis-lysogeny pheromone receptor, partial [Bacillus velezensis]
RKSFFKQCYAYRLAEIMMPVHLHFSNFEAARHFSEIIVYSNISPKALSDGYYGIGMSYLLSNKTLCLEYLRRSCEAMSQIERNDLIEETKANLKMAELYFEVKKGMAPPKVDDLLDSLTLGEDDDFIKYFQFRSIGTKEGIYKGYKHFFKDFNFLFSSIIADDLVRFGVDYAQVEALKSINLKEKAEICFEKEVTSCFSHWSRCSYNRVS